jgi:photosystem II stability/assembly factor-like uncharacterized protein
MRQFRNWFGPSLAVAISALSSVEAAGGTNVWTVGVPGFNAESIAIDSQTPSTLYAASHVTPLGVYKSVDGGAAWALGNSGLNAAPAAVVVDPQTTTTLYVAAFAKDAGQLGGVYKSTDGGASWTRTSNGLPFNPPLQIGFSTLVIDPHSPSILYAGGAQNEGVYKTTDGGASWVPINFGLSSTSVLIHGLAIDPVTPTTLYAVTDNIVFKTVDGGGSWAPLNSLGGALFFNEAAVDPRSPSTLYVSDFSFDATELPGIAKSVNGGQSWAPAVGGLPLAPRGATFVLAIDPRTSAVYVGNTSQGVFKTADGGASWAPMPRFAADTNGCIFSLTVGPAGTVYAATCMGVWAIDVAPDPCTSAQGPPPQTILVASVLPSSRSVQVGTTATAFATVINAGGNAACAVGISLASAIPANLKYNTTSCATNAVTGADNAAVDVPAGASACYVISITPTAPFNPTEVAFTFTGSNTPAAPTLIGIDTLLMSASAAPVPDVVALAATATNDGILHIPGPMGTGAFAVATVNVGIAAAITVSANTGGAVLPVNIVLCQTDPNTSACISPVGPSVATVIGAGSTLTFGIFVTANGAIALDPANSRVFVTFTDSSNIVRGRTSVAVTTQ